MSKIISILALMIVLVSGIILVYESPSDNTDEGEGDGPEQPPVPEGPELPNGIGYDSIGHTLSADGAVEWIVEDVFAPLYIGREPYQPYREVASEISLNPGKYSVTVTGETFEITVPGDITRTLDWKYDDGSMVHGLSIELKMDIMDFIADTEENRAWNSSVFKYSFTDLPRLVRVDDTIRSLEQMLRSEYFGIGGIVDNGQSYADFLAAFVQKATDYPSSVDGHSGEFDYGIWGSAEYWALPLETLYYKIGDCEDTAALLCSLYEVAGYRSAMGGQSGHVFAGVSIEGFTEVTTERLEELNISYYRLAERTLDVDYGSGPESVTFYAVETIREQNPVGYLAGGDQHFDKNTMWGWAGFYPYGAVEGIQSSS